MLYIEYFILLTTPTLLISGAGSNRRLAIFPYFCQVSCLQALLGYIRRRELIDQIRTQSLILYRSTDINFLRISNTTDDKGVS